MHFLLEQCHIAFEQYPSVLLTLFLAGLVGGMTHCAGMCGPFVVAQTRSFTGYQSILQKAKGALILPYHLGRMTTYIILGVIAASLSHQVMGTPLQHWASIAFLFTAGVIFLVSALPKSQTIIKVFRWRGFIYWGQILGGLVKPLLANPLGLRGFGLGLFLGLLPCALVFAALMVVSTVSSVYIAALGMALFAVATVPSLFLVGILGSAAHRQWPGVMQALARSVMIINGLNLFALAGSMAL